MKKVKVIVIHSQLDESTRERIRQIDSSPRLQDLDVLHCFALDPKDYSGPNIDTVGFTHQVCDSLLRQLRKLSFDREPDFIIIHGAQAFAYAQGEYNLRRIFQQFMKDYPCTQLILPLKKVILDYHADERTRPRPRFHPRDPVIPGKPRDLEFESWIDDSFLTTSELTPINELIQMV